jgi:Protein kinase domain
MALASGVKLGPYEIQSLLGAGGRGEVYRARDTRLDRSVAIKILPTHLAEDQQARQRFEREARTISSLNHPNICVLHDIAKNLLGAAPAEAVRFNSCRICIRTQDRILQRDGVENPRTCLWDRRASRPANVDKRNSELCFTLRKRVG